MADIPNFYTLKGYSLLENTQITTSMEDYLEMIYRMDEKNEPLRISKLSDRLHVKPSSASKMVSNLKQHQLVEFEKYGQIMLTKQGRELGAYLLFRHKVLHDFFCFINNTSDELEQVEKIEHFINKKTVLNLKRFLDSYQLF